jgi:hypothetical protein
MRCPPGPSVFSDAFFFLAQCHVHSACAWCQQIMMNADFNYSSGSSAFIGYACLLACRMRRRIRYPSYMVHWYYVTYI